MSEIVVPALLFLSGVCLCAAIYHLAAARHHPERLTQLLFAALCLVVLPLAYSSAQVLRAKDMLAFASALKFNLSCALLMCMLTFCFVAVYTQRASKRLPFFLALCLLPSFIANPFLPYGVQYAHLHSLSYLHMPWGEVLTRGVGEAGPVTYVTAAIVFLGMLDAMLDLLRCYRRRASATVAAMLIAMGVFIAGAFQGVLVRLGVLNAVELGAFSFQAMVIVMSLVLNRENAQRLHFSEARFRAVMEQNPFSIQVLSPDGKTLKVNAAWRRLWGLKLEALTDYNILQDPKLIEKGLMPLIQQGFAGTACELPAMPYTPANNTEQGLAADRWVHAYIY